MSNTHESSLKGDRLLYKESQIIGRRHAHKGCFNIYESSPHLPAAVSWHSQTPPSSSGIAGWASKCRRWRSFFQQCCWLPTDTPSQSGGQILDFPTESTRIRDKIQRQPKKGRLLFLQPCWHLWHLILSDLSAPRSAGVCKSPLCQISSL